MCRSGVTHPNTEGGNPPGGRNLQGDTFLTRGISTKFTSRITIYNRITPSPHVMDIKNAGWRRKFTRFWSGCKLYTYLCKEVPSRFMHILVAMATRYKTEIFIEIDVKYVYL